MKTELVLLIIASFIAAFVSGAAGFGGALMLLPVVTAYASVEAAIPILTIAQLIGNLSRMTFGFKRISWKPVGLFCAAALPLAALGAFGFTRLPKDIVTRCVGAVLIGFALFQAIRKKELKAGKMTFLFGGAVVGLLSGLAGSAGPLGAAVFLSLGLPPVAYIASEATTAVAMHILKTVIYTSLANINREAIVTGIIMGLAMIAGTFFANKIIRKMEKAKFKKYVAILLGMIGLYMLIMGA